jgi:hypothetical protein
VYHLPSAKFWKTIVNMAMMTFKNSLILGDVITMAMFFMLKTFMMFKDTKEYF